LGNRLSWNDVLEQLKNMSGRFTIDDTLFATCICMNGLLCKQWRGNVTFTFEPMPPLWLTSITFNGADGDCNFEFHEPSHHDEIIELKKYKNDCLWIESMLRYAIIRKGFDEVKKEEERA